MYFGRTQTFGDQFTQPVLLYHTSETAEAKLWSFHQLILGCLHPEGVYIMYVLSDWLTYYYYNLSLFSINIVQYIIFFILFHLIIKVNTTTLQASKAALVSLYETLRVEVGADVGVTIVTPGYIESELTKGKVLLPPEGKMGVDQDMRDVTKFSISSFNLPSNTGYNYSYNLHN